MPWRELATQTRLLASCLEFWPLSPVILDDDGRASGAARWIIPLSADSPAEQEFAVLRDAEFFQFHCLAFYVSGVFRFNLKLL